MAQEKTTDEMNEAWWKSIEALAKTSGTIDLDELRILVNSETFKKAVASIMLMRDSATVRLLTIDLSNSVGVIEATRVQSKCRAYVQLFDDLFRLANPEKKKD